jgi:segregation and condensation protein B
MRIVREEIMLEEEEEQMSAPVDKDGEVEEVADDGDDSSESADIEIDTRVLEALLLATHHPLTAGRLAELMGLDTTKPIRKGIQQLNSIYKDSNRSFSIEQVAGGYQILTLPEFGEHLKKLHQREIDAKLTKAALETLAIIAYKQPILRAEIESIRGVACGETIRNLMEKHLVRIAGRAEEPGRPILYGTTKRFLEVFGLNSLKDLPQQEEGLQPQG